MQPVYAFLIMLSLITVTTTVWYFTTPLGDLTMQISGDIINSTSDLESGIEANVNRTFDLLGFALRLWGPILDLIYVVWFLIFGTRVDTESESRRLGYYG